MDRSSDLVPRNSHTLVAGIVARISGCQDQKELSLDDQLDHGKEVVRDKYEGAVDFITIATKGKGERLDRKELKEIERLIRSRKLDLLIAEDLGRIVRGAEAVWLCGLAVDHGVRVIVPNDCIDTADPSWEEDALSACRDHVGHNSHTSKRLKFKLMNRFLKLGAAMAREIYGYIVPDDAKTYDDWRVDIAAALKIQEGARRLFASLNCSAVADWFNGEGVPVGPYCRRKTWNGAMVRRFYQNPVLKGKPYHGKKVMVKHHETGRRVAVKNSKGPQFRDCPHLLILEPTFFDELNAKLDKRNTCYRRKQIDGEDPLARVPRKRTRFPGQHVRCWYCGRRFVWGANGMKDSLMCTGSRERLCWNSLGFKGALASCKLVEAITGQLFQLEQFDEQFATMVTAVGNELTVGCSDRWEKLRYDDDTLSKEKENLVAAITSFGPRPMFREKLLQFENRERELAVERRQLEDMAHRHLELPKSVVELRSLLLIEFRRLSNESPEFGDLMRQLVPVFHVYLVRLCDGGHLLPRARVKLDLAGGFPDVNLFPNLSELLSRDLTFDFFDPPQREAIRVEAVRLASQGLTHREIANRLPGRPTATAVGRAIALQRKMDSQGISEPYLFIAEPPDDYLKLRRHKHPRYRFQPLDGYPLAMP